MPKYRLIYYTVRGRGELCRLLFALGGQEYEDVRIEPEKWPSVRDNYQFGRCPVLEIDGKQYSESMALARYLASQFGLGGRTDLESLEINQVLGLAGDIFSAIVEEFKEKDPDRKAEIDRTNQNVKFPRLVGCFETILRSNNTGFYVGDRLTLADVAAFEVLDKNIDPAIIDRFTLVKQNYDKVRGNERIADWIAKRPKTEY